MEISDRINVLRNTKKLTVKQFAEKKFAEKIGEKSERISAIELKKQRTPADVAAKIVQVFCIDAHCLLTGQGDIYSSRPLISEKLDALFQQLTDTQKAEISSKIGEMITINRLQAQVQKLEERLEIIEENTLK